MCCKENRKETNKLGDQSNKSIKKDITRDKYEQITILELRSFFNQLNIDCENEDSKLSKQISSEVLKKYPDFCKQHKNAYAQREGEIEFNVIEKEKEGVITINSIQIIEDDGENYRNEYSTFYYIRKKENQLIVYNIGGAG